MIHGITADDWLDHYVKLREERMTRYVIMILAMLPNSRLIQDSTACILAGCATCNFWCLQQKK